MAKKKTSTSTNDIRLDLRPKPPVTKASLKPIIFESHLAPGDIICMTAGIRDLHINHPNVYATEVRTTAMEIWEGNQYITKINRKDDEITIPSGADSYDERVPDGIKKAWEHNRVPVVQLNYPLIHRSNGGPNHFTEGYTDDIEFKLGIRIRKRLMKGDIYITENERKWISQVHEITKQDTYYWIVVNGGKLDFTAKWWDPLRMQRVVNSMRHITFVQVGEKSHYHVPLHGHNVIDLLGKTSFRELIRLVYHSSGVICPVTALMHLAAAVPVRQDKCYGRKTRPCVVIAGGREPSTWEAYCNHAYLHNCGSLPCCEEGGCWKSRVLPLGDGDSKDKSLCLRPTLTENGVTVPECLNMVTVDHVVDAITRYLP